MKLSKTSQWILAIGILAILIVSLGVRYSRQKAEQSQLIPQIAQAQQDFRKYSKQAAEYTAEKKELEARLTEANARIASIQDEFRQYTQSIEINETLFQAAKDAKVTVTKLSSSLPLGEELNGIGYQVFSIDVTARGEVVALLNFTRKLSERFSAATIESVEIAIPAVKEAGSEEKPRLNLRLKIYVYEGE